MDFGTVSKVMGGCIFSGTAVCEIRSDATSNLKEKWFVVYYSNISSCLR